MKQLHLIILFILVCLQASAQEFKLGKVSMAELEQKVHPADTSAPAAILFKNGKSYFEISGDHWMLVNEVQARIKIYKKEGYEHANEEVGYYTGGRNLKVYFDDAYTYNLVGGKIEKTKLKSDGEFEEKINDNVSVKKIVMPNVKVGSVIEYRYVIKTPYFHTIPDWHFQYEIPANNVKYEITLPSCFLYNRYLQGYIDVKQAPLANKTSLSHSYTETISVFTAKDVKALKAESYVNNIRNYLSILKHELATVQYAGQIPEYYSQDWASMTKKIYENSDFGKQINARSYFEDDMKALLPAGLTGEQKISRIFTYVKQRMNWNKEDGFLTEKGVSKAYKDKVGNVADINLMLTAMLRYAGLDANPVLVSTRSNGVALYPSLYAYDYVIAAVKTDKDYVLLDATSKYSLPDIIPVRCLNWEGRMIKENGTAQIIDLMPKMMSRETINVAATIGADGKITGRVVDQYTEQNALSFREVYTDINRDSYIERLEKHFKGLQVNEYAVSNEKDITKPVIEDFTFEHNNLVDIIGDKMYLNPMFFYTRTINPFKEEKREYPIDFTFPQQDRYAFIITVPEGYAVESLPKPISLTMEENIGFFKYNIASNGNQIHLNVQYAINYANVSQAYYETIREFFKKMVEKQTEKVVLKKA